MISFRANWERAVFVLAGASTIQFLLVSAVAFYAAGNSQETSRALFLLAWLVSLVAWLLPVLIVLAHSWSTFKISNGKFVHLRFGRPVREIPINELVELCVSAGVLPGSFRFNGGRVVRVSGIALGASAELRSVLESHGVPMVERVR